MCPSSRMYERALIIKFMRQIISVDSESELWVLRGGRNNQNQKKRVLFVLREEKTQKS